MRGEFDRPRDRLKLEEIVLEGFFNNAMDGELNGSRTKAWMFSRQASRTGVLLGSDPDRACPADKCERIVADDLCRPLKREDDRVVGVWANGFELICDSENDAGGVGAVGEQSGIVRQYGEFAVGTPA